MTGEEAGGERREDAEAWIRARRPAPPPSLIGRLDPYVEGRSATAGELGEAGAAAMERALALPPGERQAAFHLLAADALLTYACEAASAEADCRRELAALLDRVGRGGDRER